MRLTSNYKSHPGRTLTMKDFIEANREQIDLYVNGVRRNVSARQSHLVTVL